MKTNQLAWIRLLISAFLISFFMLIGLSALKATAEGGTPTPAPTLLPPDGDKPDVIGIISTQGQSAEIETKSEVQSIATSATVLDRFYVSSRNSNPTTSNISLKKGTNYQIRISGYWMWGGCDEYYCPNGGPEYLRWGDAGFLTDDHFHNFSDPLWRNSLYLEMNGSKLDFASYSPNHIYHVALAGNDTKVSFRIMDCMRNPMKSSSESGAWRPEGEQSDTG